VRFGCPLTLVGVGKSAFVPLDPLTSRDCLAAGMIAAVVSGVPSTAYAFATGGDPLEATVAAGSLVLPQKQRPSRALPTGLVVHVALSLGWAVPICVFVPSRKPVLFGLLAGLGIAALDLGIIGRHTPRIRTLSQGPQVADHLAYGVAVATVASRRRRHQAWAVGVASCFAEGAQRVISRAADLMRVP
jgi:hypothetical protein